MAITMDRTQFVESEPDKAEAVKPKLPPGFQGQAPLNEGAEVQTPDDKRGDLCPRCGWNTAIRPVIEITDEDKQEFIRSTIGGRRFTKKFKRLDDQVVIEFRTPMSSETDKILRQLSYDTDQKRITNDVEFMVMHARYRLIVTLKSLVIGDKPESLGELAELEPTYKTDGDYKNDPTILRLLYKRVTEKWGEPLYNIIMLASQQFQREYDVLTQRAPDENFYKETAGQA